MLRCVFAALIAFSTLAVLAPEPVAAQPMFQRTFPPDALRGEMTFGNIPPEVQLNASATRLAPGARVRGPNNMIVMADGLRGQTFVAHYTKDLLGQPKDVWLLRPDEVSRTPWPTNADESRTWSFNATTQIWTKP